MWQAMLFVAVASLFGLVDEAGDNLKAYPPAEAGMVRHVVYLPKQADETGFQVELIAGKTVAVDARNRFFFGGRIEEQTVEGWGYPKYVLKELGPMGGTLIAVDPSEPKVERFIALGGGPLLVRYNSRLPLVVYAPAGVEVRYRVWVRGIEAVVEQG